MTTMLVKWFTTDIQHMIQLILDLQIDMHIKIVASKNISIFDRLKFFFSIAHLYIQYKP